MNAGCNPEGIIKTLPQRGIIGLCYLEFALLLRYDNFGTGCTMGKKNVHHSLFCCVYGDPCSVCTIVLSTYL
uniref:Uncharacterized protein n=1 Tax=Anguilla anguilla TaxID=7936 RepID=A0A0E9TSN0_ANGAN